MSLASLARSLGRMTTSLALPPRCVLCNRQGSGCCTRCIDGLPPAPDLAAPPAIDRCWSLLDYDGPTPKLIAALKYRNHRDATDWITRTVARLPDRVPEAVTWAPTSASRRRERGYDQAELLARGIARHLGVPATALLTRSGNSHQTGSSRAQRLQGPRFVAAPSPFLHLLVIDDVRTTGATLSAAATALRGAGAAHVDAATVAAVV